MALKALQGELIFWREPTICFGAVCREPKFRSFSTVTTIEQTRVNMRKKRKEKTWKPKTKKELERSLRYWRINVPLAVGVLAGRCMCCSISESSAAQLVTRVPLSSLASLCISPIACLFQLCRFHQNDRVGTTSAIISIPPLERVSF